MLPRSARHRCVDRTRTDEWSLPPEEAVVGQTDMDDVDNNQWSQTVAGGDVIDQSTLVVCHPNGWRSHAMHVVSK